MSEHILEWIGNELSEADLLTDEGSYDGEDYWRGCSDILHALRNKLLSGEISVE